MKIYEPFVLKFSAVLYYCNIFVMARFPGPLRVYFTYIYSAVAYNIADFPPPRFAYNFFFASRLILTRAYVCANRVYNGARVLYTHAVYIANARGGGCCALCMYRILYVYEIGRRPDNHVPARAAYRAHTVQYIVIYYHCKRVVCVCVWRACVGGLRRMGKGVSE